MAQIEGIAQRGRYAMSVRGRILLCLYAILGTWVACAFDGRSSFQQFPVEAAGYRLVFEDNFNSFDLSPDGKGVHTWYEGLWFRHDLAPLENIEHSQDGLSLVWRRGQKIPETSITTLSHDLRNCHAWRYGYFEARMRWEPLPGAWPALWLIPVQDADGRAVDGGLRESGEIDIFEGQGDRPRDFYATIHRWVNGKDVQNNGTSNRELIPLLSGYADWHTYGLLWTPEKITWFFDGRPIHSEASYPIFSRQDYYLVLSEQLGQQWQYGKIDGSNERELRLDVQWVRVWQK